MLAAADCIPSPRTSEADYERIFRFNYFAQTYLARSVLAQWTQRKIAGHLIFTSSYVARMPHTQIPSYSSAKAALENFARSLALEYALTGIRVNVVSPGNVAAGSSLKVFDEDPAYREFVLRVSLGRRNSPESIADAFVFLCSPLAARSTDKFSAPITAQASGIAYEDWPGPLPSHADARLLRLRAPGRLHSRRCSSGRLFQSGPFQSA